MPINFKFKKVSGRKRTAARTATRKKKSSFNRRASYRSKKKKWWKKYKKSNRYKNGRLLKHTTKCSLSELVEWMYPNVGKLVEAIAINPYSSTATGAGRMFVTGVSNVAHVFLRTVSQCLDDRSVFNQGGDADSHATQIETFFAAFNPIIDRSQAGPLFNTYMNMYRWMKFVGIKVKWVPNSKFYNCFSYDRNPNGTVATATDGNGVPGTATGISPEFLVQYKAPPKVYMNVMFKKDCFVSSPTSIRSLNVDWTNPTTVPLTTGYYPPANKYIDIALWKLYKFADNQGASFLPSYKKYDLSKRFKFYVRPYEHSLKYEVGCNPVLNSINIGTAASTSGYYRDIYGGLNEFYYNRNIHESKPHKASWKATDPNIPGWLKAAPNQLVDAAGVCKAQAWINSALDDNNYYNPTLFGFNFSYDARERNKCMNLVAYNATPPGEISHIGTLLSSVTTTETYGNEALGNFYFTVYYRFKGKKPNQSFNTQLNPGPSYQTPFTPAWYT